MSLWQGIGRQLAHPRGFAGRVTGMAMRVVNRAPNRLAIAALDPRPGDDVLELGFGPGDAIADLLARVRTGKIHGIDASDAMVSQATRRNRRAIDAGRVMLRAGDCARLPYPDDSFDKVLAVNVAYFWQSPARIAREIGRVLRPGGCLTIYATDGDTMRRWRFADHQTHRHIDVDPFVAALVEGAFDRARIDVRRHRLPGDIQGLVIAVRA